MKYLLFITLTLALAACDHDSKNKFETTANDGTWELTPVLLEGNCSDPAPIVFTVYKNEVYDAPQAPDPTINAAILGFDFSATVTYSTGDVATLEGEMRNGMVSGDWTLTDNTCFGYFTGQLTD